MTKKKLRILAAGDFQGNPLVAENLAKKAEKEKVDLVVLAGDLHGNKNSSPGIMAPFKKRNQTVIFVPGNWDTTAESNLLSKIYQVKNIDGKYAHYHGVDFIGIGSPDFRLNIDSRENLDKMLKSFEKVKSKPTKKVLVSHLHARDTVAEFSGFKGSKLLKDIIDYFQPDIFISSHIHEAEGLEQKIGKTKLFQVGKTGKIIEIG